MDQAGSVFWQAMHGMSDMHEHNLSHNDFKLENMLIDNGGNVRVMDFGSTVEGTGAPVVRNSAPISTMEKDLLLYTTTPSLIAPESFTHSGDTRKSKDVWAAD